MRFGKPSVAKGTKIVDKMLRQIENEIAAFEAAHAKNVKAIDNADKKYDAIYERYIGLREKAWQIGDAITTMFDKVAYKLSDIGNAKMEKTIARKVAAKEQNVEHTADIEKLSRIRDKVATLAD